MLLHQCNCNMNKAERVQFIESMEAYSRKHQLREYFLKLISDLSVARPEDPITYLIDKLTEKRTQRVFFLNFFETDLAEEVASYICNAFNFKLIKASGVAADSKRASQKVDFLSIDATKTSEYVLSCLKKVEPLYKGVMVVGYPNEPGQADFICKKGYLAQRTFLVELSPVPLQIYYKKLHPHAPTSEIKLKVSRTLIWQKELKAFLGPNATVLTLQNKDKLQANLKSIISIKDRKQVPITSIRVAVLHPPYVSKAQNGFDVVNWVSQKFGLVEVSLQRSVSGEVEEWVRSKGKFTEEIEHSIIYTRCTSTQSKMKGFVLGGWPNSLSNKHFFTDSQTVPHFTIVLEDSHQFLTSTFSAMKGGDPVFSICGKPTLAQYQEQLAKWVQLKDWVLQQQAGKCQVFKLDGLNEESVGRVIELQLLNPKIYS